MKNLILSGLLVVLGGNLSASQPILDTNQVVLKAALVGEHYIGIQGHLTLENSAKSFASAIKVGNMIAAQNDLKCLNCLLSEAGGVAWTSQHVIKGWFKNQVTQTSYVLKQGLGLNSVTVEMALKSLNLVPYEDLLTINLEQKTAYLKAYLEAMAQSLARPDIQTAYVQIFHRIYGEKFRLLQLGSSVFDILDQAQVDAVNEVMDLDEPEEEVVVSGLAWKTKTLISAPLLAILAIAIKRNF